MPSPRQPRAGLSRDFSKQAAKWARIASGFTACIRWLRAGYPPDAPATGYSPIVALCGRASLTQRQVQRILTELDNPLGKPPTDVDIKIAITKVSHNLPSQADLHRVRTQLAHRQQ